MTVVIKSVLTRQKLDILHKTHLADTGMLKERDYTFFFQGRRTMNMRFVCCQKHFPEKGFENLLMFRLRSSDGSVTLIAAYAPTLAIAA